ncbi:MAG TPA: CHAD domain-containing protein [Allosphingosinicella sp.]|nr:CHAD domain-containing protein [Allosphingosinicella sp.]
MQGGNEVELKLEIEPRDAPELIDHVLLRGRQMCSGRQSSVYYDTGKGALREAGYSLRVRSSGGRFVQTVKRQGDGGAGLFDRPEWEREIAGAEPDLAALDETPLGPVLAKGRLRKRLKPIVSAEVERTVWLLPHEGSEIEMVLDRGAIRGGKREAEVSEVELELRRGKATALLGIARLLAEQVPLKIGVMTKAERGFALAGGDVGKAAKAEPVGLDAQMSVADGFAAIVHACLRHFRRNEPLVLGERDAAALHQSRVAMRRLRSAFSLFGPAIADAEFGRLREELRWFTEQLGEARNLDVFLKRLPDGRRTKAFRRRLGAARERAYDRVIEALHAKRMRAMMIDLVAWAEVGAWRNSEAAAAPLPSFAEAQLDRRWRKVRKNGRDIAGLDPEPRHRLRIDVKKLRYAVEFLAGLHAEAPSQKPFIAALEAMQERLGELNDMETARELVAGLPEELRAEASAFAASNPREEAKRTETLLAEAQAAQRRLTEAGPFWRSRGEAAAA